LFHAFLDFIVCTGSSEGIRMFFTLDVSWCFSFEMFSILFCSQLLTFLFIYF
jgi:hypothetical protein